MGVWHSHSGQHAQRDQQEYALAAENNNESNFSRMYIITVMNNTIVSSSDLYTHM